MDEEVDPEVQLRDQREFDEEHGDELNFMIQGFRFSETEQHMPYIC